MLFLNNFYKNRASKEVLRPPKFRKKNRFNNSIFMAKSLRKAIMLKSQLKSKFNNNKSQENYKKYKQQRNYFVKPLRKTIKCNIFKTETLIRSMITMFWKTAKPRFSNKCRTKNTIILTERDAILKSDKLIVDTFNNYCTDIAKTLKLKKYPNLDALSLFSITDHFKKSLSVQKLKKSIILKRAHLHLLCFQKRKLLKP